MATPDRGSDDLVYRSGATYECVYCGDLFLGNDRHKDIYRCDQHLLHSSERPIYGGNNNPVLVRLYYMHRKKIPSPVLESFPLIRDIVQKAVGLTRCQFRDIDAHTHNEIYRICIPGVANPSLWNDAYMPTTTLLHEYAHLVSQAGHYDESFWEANRALHKEHHVSYDSQERIRERFGW